MTWDATDPETNKTMVWDNECRMGNDPNGEIRKVILHGRLTPFLAQRTGPPDHAVAPHLLRGVDSIVLIVEPITKLDNTSYPV